MTFSLPCPATLAYLLFLSGPDKLAPPGHLLCLKCPFSVAMWFAPSLQAFAQSSSSLGAVLPSHALYNSNLALTSTPLLPTRIPWGRDFICLVHWCIISISLAEGNCSLNICWMNKWVNLLFLNENEEFLGWDEVWSRKEWSFKIITTSQLRRRSYQLPPICIHGFSLLSIPEEYWSSDLEPCIWVSSECSRPVNCLRTLDGCWSPWFKFNVR